MGVDAITTEKKSEGEKASGLSPGNLHYLTAGWKKRRTGIGEHAGENRKKKHKNVAMRNSWKEGFKKQKGVNDRQMLLRGDKVGN